MKKKILVSVDAGETRVAVLEAKGRPRRRTKEGSGQDGVRRTARATTGGSASSTSSAAARARSSATSTRASSTTSCPAWRRPSSTSASSATASCTSTRSSLPDGKAVPEARPRPGPADRRADQARPGDRRPGRQGPAEDEGRAALDAPLDRRPLPRLHAAGRRDRRQPPAPRRRAQPDAQDRSRSSTTPQGQGRLHRPHRRPGRARRRTSSARSPTCTSSTRCSSGAPRTPRRRR